jgi:hypothetical protein
MSRAFALSLALLSPQEAESPFGVLDFLPWNHEWNHRHYPPEKVEKAADLMKEAGIGWVRMDFLWNDLEPAPGRFEWAKYDALVDALARRKLRVLGILCYTAGWTGKKWNDAPPAGPFLAFAAEVVRRYKDRVRHWEVWNEPDSPAYWNPQDGLAAYSALLRETAAAVRKEDPGAKVLHGGIADASSDALERLYRQAGKASFDVLNVHPFVDPNHPDPMKRLRELVDRARKTAEANGDGAKELWLTEIGCPGMKTPAAAPNWWLGSNPDEEQQAAWVRRVYGEPLRWPGVRRVFWAFFRDTPRHFHSGVDFLGLVREDFSKKPAFDAYREAAAPFKR